MQMRSNMEGIQNMTKKEFQPVFEKLKYSVME